MTAAVECAADECVRRRTAELVQHTSADVIPAQELGVMNLERLSKAN